MADQLQKADLISKYVYDCENVYEWVEAPLLLYPAKLNLSRNHHHGPAQHEAILVFCVISPQNWRENIKLNHWVFEIAQNVHERLHLEVEIGRITYLRDDKFSYKVEKSLASNI